MPARIIRVRTPAQKKALRAAEAPARELIVRPKVSYPMDNHILDGTKLPVRETQEYVVRVKVHGDKVSWLDVSSVIEEALLAAMNKLNDTYRKKSYLHKTLIYAPSPVEKRYENVGAKPKRR